MSALPDHIVPEALAYFLKFDSFRESANMPTSPLITIEKLDKEVIQLQRLLEAFERDIHRRTIDLLRNRNQLTPIYQLPPELIGRIFHMVQLMADEINTYDAIKSLASVSSYWYSNVLSDPQLWVHVRSSYHLSFVKSIIKRSKSLPLHIRFSANNHDDRGGCQKAFLDLVSPHIARWKTCLSLSNDASRMLSSCKMHGSADLLESYEARIFPISHSSPPTLPTWTLRAAPRLRSLSITFSSFPLGAQVLSQLRSIEFSATIGRKALTADQWLKFLSTSPHLEVIHAEPYLLYEPDSSPTVPVHLPKLRSITLRGFSASTTGRLLSSIIPAEGTYPSIIIDEVFEIHPDNTFDTLFSFEPTEGSLLKLVRSIRWISLKSGLSEGSYATMEAGIQPNMHFLRLKFLPFEMLGTLFSQFSSQLEALAMEGPPVFEQPDFIQALPSLILLQSLIIIRPNRSRDLSFGFHDNLEDIVNLLSMPQGGDLAGVWLLPKLKHLAIGDPACFKYVHHLCKDRCTTDTTLQRNHPVLLYTLRLSPTELRPDNTTELKFRALMVEQ